MSSTRFTTEKRERLLALVELGWTIERACVETGVSRQTVNASATRGREPSASSEQADFARRLHELRQEQQEAPDPPEHPYRSLIYGWVQAGDPFVGISPDELAELTPEQRLHAVAVSEAAAK